MKQKTRPLKRRPGTAKRRAMGSAAARARRASLYDDAPIGHVTLDRRGVILEMNLTAASLLGGERSSLEARSLRPLLAAASRRALDAHLRACFQSLRSQHVELGVALPDGAQRTIELVSTPPSGRVGPAGRDCRVVHSAIIDVSQRKLDEERQRMLLEREHAARLLAESVDRVKREILTIVSHELRTPLAPMRLWVNALRVGGLSDTLRARAIDALETCLKVQVALIDDLIDVARGESGKLKIERRPMDLGGVVNAAIEAYAPSAAAKHIGIELEVDAGAAWVSGDPTRLQQVVGNLLSNAIKFTPEAGHVTLSLRARGAEVNLVVGDDGEGIEADLLERIFEPFQNHDMTATRRHGGLGVGLTIVRQLVKEHDGRIVAESAGPRRGSRFTVTLPALEESERRDGGASAWTLAESREALRRLDRVRVLLIEDDASTRDAVAGTLRTHGAEVTTAASAADARDALERARPDVVVSDIGMPQEDGNAFIRRVRAQEQATAGAPHLPALALTIHDRQEALTAGFDHHLAKPFEPESLVKLLESLASAARSTNIGAPSGG